MCVWGRVSNSPEMLRVSLLCLVVGALADRYTDFAANKAWWTNSVVASEADTGGYRRTCINGGYSTGCNTAKPLDGWDELTSVYLPTTNAASYSGSVTQYRLCQTSDVNRAYYKFILASGSCGVGWTSLATTYFITDPSGWASVFSSGGVTYYRRDFKVFKNAALDTHLVIPVGDLAPYKTLYTKDYSFSAYTT